MTYWKTEHFKALQKSWYQRLKDEGFRDSEEMIGEELVLTPRHVAHYRTEDEVQRSSKEHYYHVLSQQIECAEFRNEIDRIILASYAEGQKIKMICEELKRRGTARCRLTIRMTVRRYEMLWGIREYTPRQMNKYQMAKKVG